ncbi:hypothetical protein [Solicola sp. PLA-1-18]|uniref:hypothetical protein n=1 Tax=Solicola sp. PLA-1-18 TaxID=3380532 RepID=UPI003B799D3C
MTDDERLWHVTVTVAGRPHDQGQVREAMDRLRVEHAFLHSLRYASDRAELCYWEQAPEMLDAAAMAMRVWLEHRESAGLPQWEIVGLEVLERDMYLRRDEDGPRRRRTDVLGASTPTPVPF